jgi:hypothetical protein
VGRRKDIAVRATGLIVALAVVACGVEGEYSDDEAAPPPPLPKVANVNWGWVSPDPTNPRYLWLGGGLQGWPYSITSYGSLVPCSFRGDEAAYLKRMGASYAVVWQRWSGCGPGDANWFETTWRAPWRLACDPRDPEQHSSCPDRPRWDLGQFDDAYWRRLTAVLDSADDATDGTGRRLVVKVHLFARQDFEAGHDLNPFRGGNNVNGVRSYDGDPARDPMLRYFAKAPWVCAAGCEEPAKSLFDYQKAYVRQLLDVTHGHGNVIYQLLNEPPSGENPGGESTAAFAYFTEYWAWFVKDHLDRTWNVARLVSADENNDAYRAPNVDIADARWANDSAEVEDARFLDDVVATLSANTRANYLAYEKATALDELGNSEAKPDRLRKAAWALVTSGGHFHIEDPCNPEFRACNDSPEGDGVARAWEVDSRPWVPIQSIEAFKAASGWRFDRAQPVYREAPPYPRWFFWMMQGDPAYDKTGFAGAGVLDHVGYLAHRPEDACLGEPLASDLPATPAGTAEYVARLWDPAGVRYLGDGRGGALEHHFAWRGGAFDWCETPFQDAILESDDLVFHVRSARSAPATARGDSPVLLTQGRE